jgi:hypothetical protein
MRYSLMLQLVAGTTLILLSTAALFAWLQNRTEPVEPRTQPVSSRIVGVGIACRRHSLAFG